MPKTPAIMTEECKPEGPGERAERARRNRYAIVFGTLMAVGGVIGAVLGVLGPYEPGSISPALAITAATLYVVAVPLGSWFFLRNIDEVELKANLVASTWGLSAYVLLYPAWYMLWKGGVVGEPAHETLFMATAIVTGIAYFWKKARP